MEEKDDSRKIQVCENIMTENEKTLPTYWIRSKLGEVCHTTSGGTPSRKNPSFYEGNTPWVKSGELNYNIILETDEHISEDAIKKSSAKVFPKGTLLIALYGATIGKLAFLGIEAATNQAVCAIFKNEIFEPKFLYYLLFHRRQDLVKEGIGGAQPNISQTILKNLEVPICPLPEQRAIVSKIEQLFSELDNGISNLKLAQEQLKVYRQAVLKKAFEGCAKVPFSDIVKSSQNGISKRSGKEGSEFKVLRLADISNLEIDYSSPRCIRLTSSEINKYKLCKNDLVCIRVNGSKNLVGRLIITSKKDDLNNWAFCDHFIRFSLDLSNAIPKYYYYFQTIEVRQYIHENMVSSAGQNTVSQGTIKSILVPFNSLPEQQAIVQEIETRLSVCDKIEQDIETNLEKAEALRQSILKKAFEGKLLNEKELAEVRGEEDWEPVEALLERIKAEKSGMGRK